MNKAKRLLSVILTALIIMQVGAFIAFGDSEESDKQVITISNIDTSQLAGESGRSTTEIDAEGLPSDSIRIVSEEWTAPAEYVISGSNISIRGGKYSYRLVIRSDRTLTFDNDLEIYYQGVNGRYRLHYDIDKTDNHTMIVTGVFDNIIIASPLMEKISAAEREWILKHISKDSYFYQLVLRTKEGFSFINSLRYYFDAKRCGYMMKYKYDLATDEQTLIITGLPDCDGSTVTGEADMGEPEPETPEVTEPEPVSEPSVPAVQPETVQTAPETAVEPADINIAEISYGKLRKKAQTVKASSVMGSAVQGKGKLRFAKVSGNKKIKINKKTGKVTVRKGLKRGTYDVTVKVRPAQKSKGSSAQTVSFTIRVL